MPLGVARRPLARWTALAAGLILFLWWCADAAGVSNVESQWGLRVRPQPPGFLAHSNQVQDGSSTLASVLAFGSADSTEQTAHDGQAPGSGGGLSIPGGAGQQGQGIPVPGQPSMSGQGQFTAADDYLEHFRGLVGESPMSISFTKAGCAWPSSEDVFFQFAADSDWVVNDRSDAEITQRQLEWKDFVKNDLIPYQQVADRFSGRGIVVCAGNERSLMRLHVLLGMLSATGTILPVEVHYFGDDELSSEDKIGLLSKFNALYFNDLSGPDVVLSTKHTNFYINYNVKLAALLNSRFAEPILLDSDNIPLSDPASLYDSSTYRSFGTVFYPDIARTRPQNPMWAITNTPCRSDEYEMESGQLVVDKKRFWYHLQLAAWFGHQEYYQQFLLGDKDCFRFAWHALKTPYGRPARWITSLGFVARPAEHHQFPDKDSGGPEVLTPEKAFQGGANSLYCGHSFGQHHPDRADSPLLFVHGGLVKTLSVQQIMHVKTQGGGLFRAYKQSAKANGVSDVVEKVAIKFDRGASYLDPHTSGNLDHIAQCTDMAEVEPLLIGNEATKELIGFEEAFERAGGFWMLDSTLWDSGHTVFQ